MKRRASLVVTSIAVVFLTLDGLLLMWVGLAFGGLSLVVLGLGFLAVAVVVIVYYRRYLRNLSLLEAAQIQLKNDIERMVTLARDGVPGGSVSGGSIEG